MLASLTGFRPGLRASGLGRHSPDGLGLSRNPDPPSLLSQSERVSGGGPWAKGVASPASIHAVSRWASLVCAPTQSSPFRCLPDRHRRSGGRCRARRNATNGGSLGTAVRGLPLSISPVLAPVGKSRGSCWSGSRRKTWSRGRENLRAANRGGVAGGRRYFARRGRRDDRRGSSGRVAVGCHPFLPTCP